MNENLYDLLGVDKTASHDEIKKAYRKKSKEHHPDKGGDEEMFKKISLAYESLSDTQKRANYDRFGSIDGNKQQQHPFESFRRGYSNNFHRPTRKGSDLHIVVKLTLEEIYHGVTKILKYKRQDKCSVCNGQGHITDYHQTHFGTIVQTSMCNTCEGSGKVPQNICKTCNSSGIKTIDDSI